MVRKYGDLYLQARRALLPTEGENAAAAARELLAFASGKSVAAVLADANLYASEQIEADLKLVLHPVAAPLQSHDKPNSLAFLIGPEGGLSDAEVDQAKAAGFHSARLGPRVLRTETAPVVALSVAQQLWGDLQA